MALRHRMGADAMVIDPFGITTHKRGIHAANAASRLRGAKASAKQHRPVPPFDWDRAITGLHRIFAELDRKEPRA